ncbi:MAG: CRISPR-associated protein Cas4 [Nitrospirales bacterium]
MEDKADDPIMISALEHWSYCPRQCALIHVEQTFDENLYTLRGRAVHKRVDEPMVEEQAGMRIERALPLWSKSFGLVGKGDVVEFHGETPYPVEYKHGPHREQEHDDLQLCAQALCLEEMTGQSVPRGAIYHHSSRKRREVEFTAVLRARVVEVTGAIRAMLKATRLPPPVNDHRCTHCSLQESCMPSVIDEGRRASAVVRDLFTIHM